MQKILLALDGSAESGAAARWTAALADDGETEVVAVTVLTPRLLGRLSDAETGRSVEQLLDDEWTEPLHRPGLSWRWVVRDGDAGEEIAAVAEAEAPDLVVLGAPTRGRLPALRGDVARAVAHRVHAPMVAVRGEHRPLRGGRFVVGVDGSPGSAHALRWAVALAERLDAQVIAAFAHDLLADSYPHPPVDNWRYVGELEARQVVASIEDEAHVPIAFRMLGGDAAAVIDETAAATGAALIVAGKRSRHSLGGAVVGRVPVHLVHSAPCPVVLLPSSPTHPVRDALERIRQHA